jgi:hypothetical protein
VGENLTVIYSSQEGDIIPYLGLMEKYPVSGMPVSAFTILQR